jgi:hypothetical protein
MSTPSEKYSALARFGELARAGRHPAASSGERVANKLAKALHAIGDDMALLDDEAITGFHLLCQLTSGPWSTDADKERVFEMLAHAAG